MLLDGFVATRREKEWHRLCSTESTPVRVAIRNALPDGIPTRTPFIAKPETLNAEPLILNLKLLTLNPEHKTLHRTP